MEGKEKMEGEGDIATSHESQLYKDRADLFERRLPRAAVASKPRSMACRKHNSEWYINPL